MRYWRKSTELQRTIRHNSANDSNDSHDADDSATITFARLRQVYLRETKKFGVRHNKPKVVIHCINEPIKLESSFEQLSLLVSETGNILRESCISPVEKFEYS